MPPKRRAERESSESIKRAEFSATSSTSDPSQVFKKPSVAPSSLSEKQNAVFGEPDIFETIFTYADPPGVIAATYVCKDWLSAISGNATLRKRLASWPDETPIQPQNRLSKAAPAPETQWLFCLILGAAGTLYVCCDKKKRLELFTLVPKSLEEPIQALAILPDTIELRDTVYRVLFCNRSATRKFVCEAPHLEPLEKFPAYMHGYLMDLYRHKLCTGEQTFGDIDFGCLRHLKWSIDGPEGEQVQQDNSVAT